MDAISIEEANKIRIAMGMKPLPVPGAAPDDGPVFKESNGSINDSDEDLPSTLESRHAAASQNWQNLQQEADAKAKRQAQKDAIKKARDAAAKFAKLEGKGLGDEDDAGDLDTKTWLLQQRKRQKKLEKARARQREHEELEREAEARVQYSSADLAGVKVGHEVGQFFGDDGEQILTLKDAEVNGDDEDDELENIDLKEKELIEERLESKKRKRGYNPHDDPNGEHSILSQYDEEIDGKKKKLFTLDSLGRTGEESLERLPQDGTKANGVTVSLNVPKDKFQVSDYVDTPAEIKVRKPKKKKPKALRKKADEEGTISTSAPDGIMQEAMDIDGNAPLQQRLVPKKSTFDESFDDDDLQTRLAASRAKALKNRKQFRPEDLAREIREEVPAMPNVAQSAGVAGEDENDVEGEPPGLVLDETTEFVANLQRPEERRTRRARSTEQDGDVSANREKHHEDMEVDFDMAQVDSANGLEEHGRDSAAHDESTVDITTTGLDEEATLNQGLGSTLSMLTQRGLVKKTEDGDLNSYHREREQFLIDKQKAEDEAERRAREQRERDRRSGRLDNLSARDREEQARFNNVQRDQVESRRMADIFNKQYKPNVDLKYIDEFGRRMNQKEAFKHLSHQFHGKGSGKQKTEKRLKKIEDEKKREAMSSLDSSQHTGMNNAMGATARKNRQAGVRLQ